MAVNKRKTKTNAEKKKAKQKFTNKVNVEKKLQAKRYENYLNIQRQHEDMLRRATIVEALYSSRPKLSKIVDDKLILDMDNVYLNSTDNILYWTADNNPVVAGLAPDIDSYSLYTEEFINNVLGFIHMRNSQSSESAGDFDIIEVDATDVDADADNNTDIQEEITSATVLDLKPKSKKAKK